MTAATARQREGKLKRKTMKDNEKSPRNSTVIKKTAFLAKMRATLGNITASCKEAEIDRKTYYNWLEADPDFKQAVEDINEESVDFAESSLKQQIKDGDTTATIFYLKTKGKKRGYVEKTETESIVKAEVSTEDPYADMPIESQERIAKVILEERHKHYKATHDAKKDTDDE